MVMGPMESMARTSHLSGGNLAYIEALYERYLEDASEVPAEWRDYFDKLSPGAGVPGVLSSAKALDAVVPDVKSFA